MGKREGLGMCFWLPNAFLFHATQSCAYSQASFKEAPESPSKAESPSVRCTFQLAVSPSLTRYVLLRFQGMRDWLSKAVGSPIRSQKKTISPTKELEGKEEVKPSPSTIGKSG